MLKILSLIGLIAAVVWAVSKPGYDSILAVVGAIGTLITSFTMAKKAIPQQNQVVGENGFGIQAGESIQTGTIYKKSKDNK